jgi:hypothetical protein
MPAIPKQQFQQSSRCVVLLHRLNYWLSIQNKELISYSSSGTGVGVGYARFESRKIKLVLLYLGVKIL